MKKRNFLAVLASCAVAASMFPMTVGATGTNYSEGLTTAKTTEDKPVSNNTTEFDKYLVMDVNANVPNAAFSFAVAKYDSTKDDKKVIKEADETHLAVLNGVGGAVFTVDSTKSGSETAGEVKFVQADTTDAVIEGTTGADTAVVWNDETSGNEKYAKKTLTLDFSNVAFDEPGVYRYLITETGTNQGIENDTGVASVPDDDDNETMKTYRTLDVYVEDYAGYYAALDDETKAKYPAPTGKELLITDYVLYNGKSNDAPSKNGGTVEKSTSYTNTYTSYDLTFSKTVTGNQGSKDKYFQFNVKISNAVAGTVYDVDLTKADGTVAENSATNADYIGKKNPTSITADNEGKATATFYLQNGQSIKILGLAEGTAYEIEETPEDYVASARITGDTKRTTDSSDVALADNKVFDTELTEDTTVAFTNNRQGAIPTGVILSVAAPVAIGVAVLGGIVFLFVRNKKRDTEEEE